MAKSIVAIGLSLASDSIAHENFNSKVSLLDWDIILFQPNIENFLSYAGDPFEGKPCLNDSNSFALKEQCEHWRREIKEAYEAGKSIVVFLSKLQEVYIANGEKRYSGTGRNRQTTRIVVPHNNYTSLPLTLKPINTVGKAMKLTPQGVELLGNYWTEYSAISEYSVILQEVKGKICVVTRSGDKSVGAVFQNSFSSGSILLLPDIDFVPDTFIQVKGEKRYWSPKAKQFAASFIKAILATDETLRSQTGHTPEPEWASNEMYSLRTEQSLRSELFDAERNVEEAQKHKETVVEKLNAASALRALLYEKGKGLERAIIDALRILGFEASPYKEGGSEFDVIFSSKEGRFLGEAEGKDHKAINIDKLRQLAMNIHEDLQREETIAPAKGVLFGNGYRTERPDKRSEQFTVKCITAAASSSVALVSTSELYKAVQYLSSETDNVYARQCREAILSGAGLVGMPDPPNSLSAEEASAVSVPD